MSDEAGFRLTDPWPGSEIATLRAERDRLKAALERALVDLADPCPHGNRYEDCCWAGRPPEPPPLGGLRPAREAVETWWEINLDVGVHDLDARDVVAMLEADRASRGAPLEWTAEEIARGKQLAETYKDIFPDAPAVQREPPRYFACGCTGPKHGKSGCSGASAETSGLCGWCIGECKVEPPRCRPGCGTDALKGDHWRRYGDPRYFCTMACFSAGKPTHPREGEPRFCELCMGEGRLDPADGLFLDNEAMRAAESCAECHGSGNRAAVTPEGPKEAP